VRPPRAAMTDTDRALIDRALQDSGLR
jgi:hypothetical protein